MTILVYLLQTSICMGFFYAFYHFVLQKETTFQFNRIYLIATVIISMLLPLIKIYIDGQSNPPFVTAPNMLLGPYMDNFENTVTIPVQEKSISWLEIFFSIYFIGVVLMIIRLILEILKIANLKQTGKVVEILGHHCVLSDKVKTPFSFFRTIYLPADHHFSEQELFKVIIHEHSHIAGAHSIDLVCFQIMGIGLWVNPMMYVYQRKLREVHEFLADAAVIKYSHWEHYAQFLLAQQTNQLHYRLSNQLVYSQLKNRLIMMTQRPSSAISRLKYIGFIPIVLFALSIFSFCEKPVSSDGHIYRSATDTLPTTYITALRLNDSPLQTRVDSKWDYTRGLPIFPGCENVPFSEMGMCGAMKMTDYINDNMKYPESMRSSGIEGKVIIKLVVGSDGYIQNVSVTESLHPDADAAAMSVFNSMNKNAGKWQPAAENGIAKEAEMWLPISFSLNSSNAQPAQNEEPYTYVEEMPRFPGCEHLPEGEKFQCANEKMFKFIYESIKYPKEDREQDLEGLVIAQFIVEPDGHLSNIRIVRGVSPGLDAEAIRILTEMNNLPQKWIPGKHQGKKVPVIFTIPFKFVLQSKGK